ALPISSTDVHSPLLPRSSPASPRPGKRVHLMAAVSTVQTPPFPFPPRDKSNPPAVAGGSAGGSLQLDSGTGFFQLRLDFFGFFLVNSFFDRFRSFVDQGLRFLQTQSGDGAYHFDHVDIGAARIGQDHVEFGLLLR